MKGFLEGKMYCASYLNINFENLIHFRTFHIVNSLPDDYQLKNAGKRLQRILLKHFLDEDFKEGRIKVNVAKVIISIFDILMKVLMIKFLINEC